MRILVVRPDAIGDVVLMIPMLNTLKATFPEAEIYTLQQRYTKSLLDNHPSVNGVIEDWKKAGKASGVLGFLKYVNHIRSFKFDAVVYPFFEPYYAWIGLLAGIPIRIGDGNKLGLRYLINRPVSLNFRDLYLHEVEQNIELLKGFRQSLQVVKDTQLKIDRDALASVKVSLSKKGWKGEGLICIHPSTGGGNRAWLPSGYAALINLIHDHTSYRVVLTGFGKSEEDIHSHIMGNVHVKPVSFFGETTLSELMALVSLCRAVIGTDTGPTHIAGALKVPVVCISPTKFVKSLRWGPWGAPNVIVGNPKECPLVCNPYTCRETYCLDAISANDVFTQLKSLSSNPIVDGNTRNKWAVASINKGFYFSDKSDLDELKQKVQNTNIEGFNCFIIVSNNALKSLVQTQVPGFLVSVISLIKLSELLRFLVVHDINSMTLVPSKNRWFWTRVIRQITALFLYSPTKIEVD